MVEQDGYSMPQENMEEELDPVDDFTYLPASKAAQRIVIFLGFIVSIVVPMFFESVFLFYSMGILQFVYIIPIYAFVNNPSSSQGLLEGAKTFFLAHLILAFCFYLTCGQLINKPFIY